MGGIRNSQHSPPRPHFKSIYASSICLFNSPSFQGIQKYGEDKRLNQRHFGSFSDVIVTPYFSELFHGNPCLLNAPSNFIFTAARILDNGLLALFLMIMALSLAIITLVLL
ncbi:unnamed protein product [Callosobruchus maculatus]|uniref:Uncharacterized protein n=1 Tax=Callosobruchus maculatus TaxID=64391 RepID=A0A653C8W2_CALMS|nr:unnamed protein product [Callosobruchus maculatus]